MKKKLFFFVILAIITTGLLYCVSKGGEQPKRFSNLSKDNVEAIAACESIGWMDNDGNCVTNGSTYYCKNDTWYEITDCLKNASDDGSN